MTFSSGCANIVTVFQLLHEHHGFFLAPQHPSASQRSQVINDRPRSHFIDLNYQLVMTRSLVAHEHHDFFLARQHPPTSRALRRHRLKSSKTPRMWRHGSTRASRFADIRSFLAPSKRLRSAREVLRNIRS